MCGIAGWVDKERTLEQERYIVKNMVDTLKNRGPDDEGIYISEHAVLGHRRLSVVDPAGGAQPMIKKIGDYEFAIVYNGELYNAQDLKKILLDKGYAFISNSDTEVLLTAYIEWKEECVHYLNGIYAFAIWEEKNQTLFMARDPLGVKPLFYTQKGSSFLFGSEIKALLVHPMVEPIVKEQGLLEILGLGPARSLGCGIFHGVEELKPAYCLTYNNKGIFTKKYWELKSLDHKESLKDTVEKVRDLLIDAVKRQLVADVPLCTFLSGGLDSSAISAIAAETFKKENRGVLNTYSIDYIDNDVYFKSSDFQPDADSAWIKKMSNFIGSDHRNMVLSMEDLVSSLKEAVLANDLPGMADVDSSLYLFCKEVSKNETVALSGECADEIFGGYPWFRREEDIQSNTFPWSKATKERAELLSDEFKHLKLEQYVDAKYKETIREVPTYDKDTIREKRMREISYLNLKWFMITLLNRKDRMSMANGLEVRVPFADYRIVEYAWNIPWEMKYCDQREKGLLRRALKGILPEDVLYRKKSPYPKTHNPIYLKLVQKWMEEIIEDPSSPVLQIIDKNKIKDIVNTGGLAFEKPWFGQLMTGPQLIAYFIQINSWMKNYNVKIHL